MAWLLLSCMQKTITLTDEAYERLLLWKEPPKESFSRDVLKKVPKRGTLGDLAEAIQKLPPLDEDQVKIMEETIAEGNNWDNSRDPWTT